MRRGAAADGAGRGEAQECAGVQEVEVDSGGSRTEFLYFR